MTSIRAILRSLGYEHTVSGSWYSKIDLWRQWYRGKTPWHTYRVYNGQKPQRCTRKSLHMAKKLAEDRADLLLNEKVFVIVSEHQEDLNAILTDNDFWTQGNQLVEHAHALGTGALIEYLERDSISGLDKVRIDYIKDAGRIWPLSWARGRVQECAFVSTDFEKSIGMVYNITLHVLENDLYVIYNHRFDINGRDIALPADVERRWDTGSPIPMFQIIRPNIANNMDEDNPMGVSLFANSLDVLKVLDAIYDSYYNEFILGRKRIFADASVLNIDTDPNGSGELRPVFDPNDTVFYNFPGLDTEKTKPLVESNMTLRINEHQQGLQDNLDLLSENCGFGKGYYRFTMDYAQTATGVISQNSQLYRKIRKEEILIRQALIGMTRAIQHLMGWGTTADISVSFDDSIIEDTNTKISRTLLELESGVIDDVMYFMETRGLTLDAAIAMVQDIGLRKIEVPGNSQLVSSTPPVEHEDEQEEPGVGGA